MRKYKQDRGVSLKYSESVCIHFLDALHLLPLRSVKQAVVWTNTDMFYGWVDRLHENRLAKIRKRAVEWRDVFET